MDAGSSMLTSFEVMVADLDLVLSVVSAMSLVTVVSRASLNCTSSKEEVEIRRAVRSGDFVGSSCDRAFDSMPPPVGLGLWTSSLWESSMVGCESDTRGVVTEDVEGARPPVKDRMDADDCDCCDWGRFVVSGASSKVSWQPCERDGFLDRQPQYLLLPGPNYLHSRAWNHVLPLQHRLGASQTCAV